MGAVAVADVAGADVAGEANGDAADMLPTGYPGHSPQ